MDIKAFEYVSAIVKHGSLSKAAEELYISQPALSQYIMKLEQTLDIQLFFREGRKLNLTPAGEVFMQDGSHILNLYSNMRRRLSDVDNRAVVNIHLGISQFYGRFYLPYILPEFLKSHPNVRFSITESLTGDLEDKLLAGKLDVCMIPMYLLHDHLDYHVIHQEEMMMAVPSGSPVNSLAFTTETGPAIRLSDLRNEEFIMLSGTQKFSSLAQKLCENSGFHPNVICEVTNWDTLNLLVQQGLGVGFVSNLISSGPKLPSSPNYYRIDSAKGILRPYGIVRSKAEDSPLILEFVDYVCSLANKKAIPNVSPLSLYQSSFSF